MAVAHLPASASAASPSTVPAVLVLPPARSASASFPEVLPTPGALAALPQTPASDLKRLGWRSVAQQVRQAGSVVVTNHRQYDAVILSIDTYNAIQQALARAAEHTQPALAALRDRFDARLQALHAADAPERLHALLTEPARLQGERLVEPPRAEAAAHTA